MTEPFDLAQTSAYQRWRSAKLSRLPRQASDLIVDVADPKSLQKEELLTLIKRCSEANMAIYRSPVIDEDKAIPLLLGQQLGLHRLDGNWLADEDGVSPIAVAAPVGDRPAFIPYTNRPIKWHTDGYYQPPERLIRAMVLHCVRPASSGGDTALLDHELAYIALRDANPEWIRALMAPDAMTIPERLDDDGIARPEQTGPVFSVDAQSGELHMRYTARTRSIVWKNNTAAWGWCATTCCTTAVVLWMTPCNPGCCTGPGIWIASVLQKFITNQPLALYQQAQAAIK
ncbi:MAG: hypothetical protein FD135_3066 [Comamonadaceae bacterium]|nr:MAG: hypothetical protein FD135_3066 [Comamonadaceae bacterium]